METTKLLKILLLEDDIDDAGLLHYELKKLSNPYELKIADSKERYEALIEEFEPSIILSDYNIPGYNVFEALDLARSKDELIPFIIISGVMGETKAIEAMINGVNDCIMKDNMIRLIPSIEREVNEANNKKRQLKEQEELLLFREVYNNSNNSVAIFTDKGMFVDANNAFANLHGYRRDLLQDITMFDVIGMENGLKIIESLKEFGSFDGELKCNSLNGDVIFIDVSSFIINQKLSNSPLIIIIEKDITDAKNMVSEKQDSERKLGNLISNLPGIVYRCKIDEYWTMLFMSDSVFPITGYLKEEIIDNKEVAYSDLIHDKDKDHVRRVIENSIERQERFSIYYRLIKKDGQVIWVWEKGNITNDSEGNPKFIDGYIDDITLERKIMLESDNVEQKD